MTQTRYVQPARSESISKTDVPGMTADNGNSNGFNMEIPPVSVAVRPHAPVVLVAAPRASRREPGIG